MADNNDKTGIRKIEIFPTNVTFLVLEDMDNIRQQLVRDLVSIGVGGKIFEAPSVQIALQICAKEKIQFFFSDWHLPDGTGHDFLKKVRMMPAHKKTPFIICTTNDEISFFLQAVSSGANDFVVKPWKIDELRKKIQLTWESFCKA